MDRTQINDYETSTLSAEQTAFQTVFHVAAKNNE